MVQSSELAASRASASALARRYGRMASTPPSGSWAPIEETIRNRVTPFASAASTHFTAAPRSTVCLRSTPEPGPAPAANTIASAPATCGDGSSRSRSHRTGTPPSASRSAAWSGFRIRPRARWPSAARMRMRWRATFPWPPAISTSMCSQPTGDPDRNWKAEGANPPNRGGQTSTRLTAGHRTIRSSIAPPGAVDDRHLRALREGLRQLVVARQEPRLARRRHQERRVRVRREPLHVLVPELDAQLGRGERVEVVAAGEQERVGDLVQLGLARDRVDHHPPAVGLEARGARRLTLAGVAGPQPDADARRLQRGADAQRPVVAADDQRDPALAPRDPEPPRDRGGGQAVERHRAEDDDEDDRQDLLRAGDALLVSCSANALADAPATMPRGAIQAMNARSRSGRPPPRVARATAAGRMTRTITATAPAPPGSTSTRRRATRTRRSG